mmetsp:Transcript_14925/g.35177  ORF Transcript_14925/g.35177 Transcript_14925/m.35177 type:complete len:318 (+) Transcript_14925:807-1760(+)
MGFAPNFSTVFALRVVQGIAMGFTNPAAYGLLADTFSPFQRSTVNSLYSSGVYLGGGLASISALLVAKAGWRVTCVVVGVLALCASANMMITSADPRILPTETNNRPKGAAASVIEILTKKPVAYLFMGSALRFCAGFGIGVWAAPYFRQTFPEFAAEYAVTNAFVVGVGGLVSSLVGGRLADRLAESSLGASARAWVVAASCILAVPAWLAVIGAGTFQAAMTFLFVEYLVAEMWFGPTISILQSCVGPSQRGTAQGLFSVLVTVGNIAPVAIGAALSKGVSLGSALSLTIPCFYTLAAVFFLVTGFELRGHGKES